MVGLAVAENAAQCSPENPSSARYAPEVSSGIIADLGRTTVSRRAHRASAAHGPSMSCKSAEVHGDKRQVPPGYGKIVDSPCRSSDLPGCADSPQIRTGRSVFITRATTTRYRRLHYWPCAPPRKIIASPIGGQSACLRRAKPVSGALRLKRAGRSFIRSGQIERLGVR